MTFLNIQRILILMASALLSIVVFAQSGSETQQLEVPTPPQPDFTGFISETYNSPDADGVWGFTIVYGFSGGELVDVQKMGEAVFMPYPAPKSDDTASNPSE